MRILITTPDLKSVSGTAAVVKNCIKYNTNSNINFIPFKIGKENYRIPLFFKIIYQFLLLFKYSWFVIRYRINCVHINTSFDKNIILRDINFVLISKIFFRKIILHVHGGKYLYNNTLNGFYKYFQKIMFYLSKTVIVLSEKEKNIISFQYNMNNIIVLPNCTQIPNNYEKIFSDRIEIVYLGKIKNNKGICELIDALKILNVKQQNFVFTLCGNGPEKTRVINILSELLGNRFIYTGIADDETKKNILKRAIIILLPSHYEAMPMSIIEGMAYGCIPVCTNIGSLDILITHNVNGIFIEPNNAVNIANTLLELINNKNKIQQLSKNAYLSVFKNFNINNTYFDNLYSVYKQ